LEKMNFIEFFFQEKRVHEGLGPRALSEKNFTRGTGGQGSRRGKAVSGSQEKRGSRSKGDLCLDQKRKSWTSVKKKTKKKKKRKITRTEGEVREKVPSAGWGKALPEKTSRRSG